MNSPKLSHEIFKYSAGGWEKSCLRPPEEALCRIIVDGQELVSMLCTPRELEALAVGCLYMDTVIESMEDILSLDMEGCTVNVRLKAPMRELPRRILTTGFGGGSIAQKQPAPEKLPEDFAIDPREVIRLMAELVERGELYRETGGVHASALYRDGEFLTHAEDVGRHNTLDKAVGGLVMSGLSPKGAVLLTTGRISSEMVSKCARMGVPLIASLSAATTAAAESAEKLGIAALGYVSREGFTVYAGAGRLKREKPGRAWCFQRL